MRTRDIFTSSDFSELSQLFLSLHNNSDTTVWWREQVIAWCQQQPGADRHDCRPHVVNLIDQIESFGWSDERVERTLQMFTIRLFKLETGTTTSEFLRDVRRVIAVDLERRPIGRAA